MQRPWRRALAMRLSIHLAFGAALPAQACWDDAAQRYQVSSALLYAIARTESGLNPQAVGRNGNGSRDIGLMQINSAWLPPMASMSAICSSPAPTSMSVPGFLPGMSPASATPGTPSAPTTPPALPCAVPMPTRCAATCLPLSPPLHPRREE